MSFRNCPIEMSSWKCREFPQKFQDFAAPELLLGQMWTRPQRTFESERAEVVGAWESPVWWDILLLNQQYLWFTYIYKILYIYHLTFRTLYIYTYYVQEILFESYSFSKSWIFNQIFQGSINPNFGDPIETGGHLRWDLLSELVTDRSLRLKCHFWPCVYIYICVRYVYIYIFTQGMYNVCIYI